MSRDEFVSMLGVGIPDINGKNIWIWGTGNTAQIYQEGLKRIDKFTICGYVDNNQDVWGGMFFGKPIISPEELQQKQNVLVMILTPQKNIVKTVGKQLDGMGIEWYGIDEAIFKIYKDEIVRCYDLLEDEMSKEIYAHIVYCRMTNNMPEEKYISFDNQYFALKQFRALGIGKEVFIDCGAYTGDTIEQYIWKKSALFEKIIAFEPDESNFQAMKSRVDRLQREWNLKEDKIELYCCGVGEKNSIASFDSKENMQSRVIESVTDHSAATVKIIALDEFIRESYSFLKADIEGYEYNMILGAKEGIKLNKPLLAICIYHNAIDMFSIMQLIHVIVPEYKFAVRHHTADIADTILYAYMDKDSGGEDDQ